MIHFTPTVCPYCGTGCGMLLEEIDGILCGKMPLKTSPVNHGELCIKGWNAHEFVQSEKRLRKPLIKKNGNFQEVSWKEAIDFTTKNLAKIKDLHGSDALAFLSCARATG